MSPGLKHFPLNYKLPGQILICLPPWCYRSPDGRHYKKSAKFEEYSFEHWQTARGLFSRPWAKLCYETYCSKCSVTPLSHHHSQCFESWIFLCRSICCFSLMDPFLAFLCLPPLSQILLLYLQVNRQPHKIFPILKKCHPPKKN